jgi:hypothetical protein
MRITRRGYAVLGISLALLAIGLFYLAGHIWYVPGEGYCVGTMEHCYQLEVIK